MPDRVHGRRSKTPITQRRGSVDRLARLLLVTALTGAAILATLPVGLANPKGGQVTTGSATISNSSPIQLDIVQSTNRAAIDWQSFDIAVGERTKFQQPSAGAMTLNRVHAADPSTIAGHLTANGSLVLINPNGVVFSKGSQVNVNSIIATPSDITNANFMAGNMRFDRPSPNPNASIVNAGTITVAQKGLAALVAPSVVNSGVIQARLGKVILAGAETFALDFYGDGLISFDVGPKVTTAPLGADGKPVRSLVSNTGIIDASGGTVLLTADAVAGILDNVIDSSGQINAQTTPQGAGTVTIDSGTGNGARLAGTIDVSGLDPGQAGGTAVVTGGSVNLASTAQVKARGPAGGGTVKIGGGPHGTDASVRNAQNTTVATGALIDASATDNGNGGNVTVWSNGSTVFNGTIYAKGGPNGGNGGWVETSGHQGLGVGATARVDALAPKGVVGTWVLDPLSITVATGGTGTLVQAADTADTTTNLTIDPATINAAAANVDLEASTFVTFTNAVNMTNAGVALNVHAGGAVTVNASITTNNGDFTVQGFNGATSAGDFTSTATINTGTGAIILNSGANLLTVSNPLFSTGTISLTADTMSLGAQIGGSAALTGQATLVTLAPSTAGRAISLGAGAATGLALTDTQLNQIRSTDVTVGSGGAGAITFDGAFTATSAFGTDAAAAGFALTTGSTAEVGSAFTLQGGFSINAGSPITLNTSITTPGAQSYTGAVILGNTATLTTSGALVDFSSTVDALNFGVQGLTVAAGSAPVSFGGAVGVSNELASLDVTGGPITLNGVIAGALTLTPSGVLTLDGGTYTIDSGATYTFGATTTNGTLTLGQATNFGAVTLGSATTIDSTNTAIDFTGTVDGASGLIVNAGLGTVTFTGVVGGTTPLASLAATGPTTLDGNITTAGAQTYNSAVTLGAATVLTSTGSGNITLASTVNGAFALALNTAGTTIFDGVIGGTTALTSLTTDAPGTTVLNGGAVTTTGAQTYNDPVTLGATDTLASTGSGTITFVSTVNGGFGLTATTAGTLSFGAVGQTTPLASLNATGGTITLGGDITTTGLLTLNAGSPLTVGVNLTSGTTVTLDSTGTISQPGGIITAATLAGNSVGGASLTNANKVNTFGGFTNTDGGLLSFTDAQSFATTGAITSSGGGSLTLTMIVPGSTMTLSGTETATNVTLVAAGSITETPPIIASTLSVTAVGPVSMADANQVGTLAASVTGAGNGFLFRNDSLDLTIGSVGALSGITTNGGAVTLSTTNSGNITLNQPINASGATPIPTVTLTSAGGISEPVSTGTITATLLSVTDSGGNAVLESANAIGTVAASVTSAGAAFTFNDGATALIVGTVNGVSGITTSDGDINLRSGGLAINQPLNAGSGTVRLVENGAVSQAAAGPITASSLSVTDSVGNVVLEATNAVTTTLAASVTSAGGAFSFNDGTQAPAVGTVAAASAVADPFSLFGAVTGGTTSNGDINLKSSGLAINQPLNAGSGTVRLVESGAVSQAVAGPITASSLSVTDSVGNVVLEAANAVGTVAASVTSAGGAFTFNDGATALTLGTVAAASAAADPSALFPAVSNVTTSNGDINLASAGVAINQPLNAGSAIVRLVESGDVSQAAGAPITASSLSVTDSVGDVKLGAINAVTTTAAIQSAPGGALSFNVGTQAPEIGTVAAATAAEDPFSLFGAVSGETTNNGTITLTASGTLTLSQSVNAGSGAVALISAGAIIQTGGFIKGSTLTVSSVGGTSLGYMNQVDNLGASTNKDGGGFLLNDAQALTVTGTVNAGTGNLLVTANGAINVTGTIGLNAGSNIVLASNGAFTQSGTLTVKSPDLVIDTTGKNAKELLDQFLSVSGSDTITDRVVITNSLFKPSGNSKNAITFKGTLAAGDSILLLLANKGAITGGSSGSPAIAVKQLGVSGTGGNAALFGSIGGNPTTTAASNGKINPPPDNDYRFNDCVIGSVTCIVLPGLVPIQPQAASQVDILVARPSEENVDAPLINIFDEERLCEQVLREDPERAREVCR